jgi:hypothetical protein
MEVIGKINDPATLIPEKFLIASEIELRSSGQ